MMLLLMSSARASMAMPLFVSTPLELEDTGVREEPDGQLDARSKGSGLPGYGHSTEEDKEAYLHMVQEVCILLIFSVAANAVIVSSLCSARDVAHNNNKECENVLPDSLTSPIVNDGRSMKGGRKDKRRKGVKDSQRRGCLDHDHGKDAPVHNARVGGWQGKDKHAVRHASDIEQADAAAGVDINEALLSNSTDGRSNNTHGTDRSNITTSNNNFPSSNRNQSCIVWDLPQLKAVLADQLDKAPNVPFNNDSHRNMMLAALCQTDPAFAFFTTQIHASAGVSATGTWA